MNNNSDDDSLSILQTYLDKHDHIFLYTELRKGANFARNLGTKKSTGICAFGMF